MGWTPVTFNWQSAVRRTSASRSVSSSFEKVKKPMTSTYSRRKGRLEVFIPGRGSVTIQTLGSGDILGWSWLIPPYAWRFDARAVEMTRAIALDGKCLRDKCEADHDLGYELLKRIAAILGQRLDATRFRLLDVYGT
jgi:CRP/FNR family cyclic AMP-dependent transcriptional regulator